MMSPMPQRIENNIRKAALYARVSTEEQAMHGVSLEAQKERLLRYAAENRLNVVDLYVDEGISARKRYTRRPAFMRMLDDVRNGKIDIILFVKLDRWFRNIADYYEVQAILDQYGVRWLTTEEEYDTTTANGRLALNIKLTIAQDESDRTSERIKFVFQNMIKEGRVISGQTSLGFTIQDKRIAINEEEAPIVRAMFEKYIDCRSVKETARYLLTEYGKNFDPAAMKRMLTNTWYIGEAYSIAGWCPAIVEEETFRLAGTLLQTRAERQVRERSDRVYLFTGLIFCGCCGRRMSTYACANKNTDGTKKPPYIYYRCPAHTRRLCEMNRQINQNQLERWLLDHIRAEADRQQTAIVKKKKAVPAKPTDTAKIMAKIEKLKNLYLEDLIPKELYERDYTALRTALEQAKQQQEQQAEQAERQALPDIRRLQNFQEAYGQLDENGKKAFWSRILHKVIVSRDGEFSISFHSF